MLQQINFYTDLPIGTLHIFTNHAENQRAIKLLKETPEAMARAYAVATKRWGDRVVKEARRCINRGMPPKGGEKWDKLSKNYVEREGGDNRIYIKTIQYFEGIGIHTETVEYYRSTKVSKRQYIGLPNGVRKLPTIGHRTGLLTLQKVAKILEYGTKVKSGRGHVPDRPLWGPLFKQFGGKESIKRYIQNDLKKEFLKLTR